MRARGSDASWLAEASRDFGTYVAVRRGIRERWGVPSEVFWWVAGEFYLGSLVLRRRPTDDEGEDRCWVATGRDLPPTP